MDDKFTLIKTYILLQLLLLHTEMIKTKYGYADTLLWILNKFEWARNQFCVLSFYSTRTFEIKGTTFLH